MLPEIGLITLILALVLATLQAIVPLIGTVNQHNGWIQLAKPLAYGQGLFLTLSFFILIWLFYVSDFSVLYIAEHSAKALPWYYRLVAAWGAHEGSMLLWVWILGLWTMAVAKYSQQLPTIMLARVLAILGWLSIGFILFTLWTSNPFERLFPVPLEGLDLNPLLQDPGMIIHPPMLYMGYVGFAVAFAFAIAALLNGELDAQWARWARPWVIIAWSFLTFGIMLGSWWAYHVLGWGGWWFWDPVENASLLPWLTGTALMHTLIATEKRGAFKGWTIFLAIVTFALSLFGTFLIRSGILTSVHAFAVDPTRGAYILIFMLLVVGFAFTLYAWRIGKITHRNTMQLLSRESLLLTNNVLLTVAMLNILLGTLYPLIIEALGLGKLSVGPPYFNLVFIPLMIPLLFFMAIGPHCRWQAMPASILLKRLRYTFLISITLGILLPWLIMGEQAALVSVGLALSFWLLISTCQDLWLRVKAAKGFINLPKAILGMFSAHVGVVVVVIGVTLTVAYSLQRDVLMKHGDSVELHDHRIELVDEYQNPGSNYKAIAVRFNIYKNEQLVETVISEKRLYTIAKMSLTAPGINTGFWKDIYIALGDGFDDNTWAVRVYYKPFIRWVWAGALLMMLGGLLAVSDRRYRKKA